MASGSDVKVTVTIEPEDARKLAAEVFELRERLKEAEDRAASWEALDAEAQIGADEVSRQLRDLKAELADVRAQWASDVGSAIARAQTAEAQAERAEWERAEAREQAREQRRWANYHWGKWQNSEKRISQYSAAARNVATSHRELWALYKEACHDNGESIKYNWEMGKQRDAAQRQLSIALASLKDRTEKMNAAEARATALERDLDASNAMIDELSAHINELEARADPYPQEELIKRDVARAAAARKVAQAYRELWARAEQYENGRWHSFETVQAIVKEREELRAEAARLDKQNWNLCARINASDYARMTAEAETARWKYETRKYTCRCAGDDHHDGCTYATIAAALRGPAQSE